MHYFCAKSTKSLKMNDFIIKENIKALINEQGFTITKLAEILNTSQTCISANIRRPSYQTIERLAAALNVPYWRLFATPEQVRKDLQRMEEEGTLTANTDNDKESDIICPHCGKTIRLHFEAQKA